MKKQLHPLAWGRAFLPALAALLLAAGCVSHLEPRGAERATTGDSGAAVAAADNYLMKKGVTDAQLKEIYMTDDAFYLTYYIVIPNSDSLVRRSLKVTKKSGRVKFVTPVLTHQLRSGS